MPVMWAINTTFHMTLKSKPSSTCIQLRHDSSNILRHQLVCHQQPQASSIAIHCRCRKLQTHSSWILHQWQSSHPLW
jgi:hypothetical protein